MQVYGPRSRVRVEPNLSGQARISFFVSFAQNLRRAIRSTDEGRRRRRGGDTLRNAANRRTIMPNEDIGKSPEEQQHKPQERIVGAKNGGVFIDLKKTNFTRLMNPYNSTQRSSPSCVAKCLQYAYQFNSNLTQSQSTQLNKDTNFELNQWCQLEF